MKYHFKVHKEQNSYWAECIELSGCVTQADTHEELIDNMKEALNLYLDEPADSKVVYPLPQKSIKQTPSMATVSVDVRIAFAFALRRIRLQKKLTQKKMADLLGIKTLYNYQRLESSKTANPNLTTLVHLKEIFPDLPIDLILA